MSNAATTSHQANDYNYLCSFLATGGGVKSKRIARPTEYVQVATEWTYEAGADNYGSYVNRISPKTGVKEAIWIGAEGSTLAEAEIEAIALAAK